MRSRLVQARGLKQKRIFPRVVTGWSRLVQARGLKHDLMSANYLMMIVAPRTGAWIETLLQI